MTRQPATSGLSFKMAMYIQRCLQSRQQPCSGGSTGGTKPILDKRDSLDPGDNVGDPLLDAWVFSVQRNSAADRHKEFPTAVFELDQSPWAGWLASGPRTFLWCCKFMSEHALHPLTNHSRFVQLSGLLPTDAALQERKLLCRASLGRLLISFRVQNSLML